MSGTSLIIGLCALGGATAIAEKVAGQSLWERLF